MKSAYRSVSFYIGQRDLEMQYKMNKIVAQCRQKCEAMQEKCREKLEQVYTAYQKMTQRCQMLEQERENLSKDKLELQEKFAEKCRLIHSWFIWMFSYSCHCVDCNGSCKLDFVSIVCRQKRKLDEMYDLVRTEVESLKRSAVQPVNHSFSIHEPDLFSNPETRMDNRDSIRKGNMLCSKYFPVILRLTFWTTQVAVSGRCCLMYLHTHSILASLLCMLKHQ